MTRILRLLAVVPFSYFQNSNIEPIAPLPFMLLDADSSAVHGLVRCYSIKIDY